MTSSALRQVFSAWVSLILSTQVNDGFFSGKITLSEMTFKEGVPEKMNFNTYRMIRHGEAPKSVEMHFVENHVDPTGLGEPPFPPIFAALANAMYKATGKRFYTQPYIKEWEKV